ncbi:beta-alanine-activating enzyme isoform X1 [Suncus etruscus]|uniref:beta-alanine-activating enzyme isoform X1 n=1 Tax=Suncus etruscus TaxID=109475 RepID=UPI0021101330|nr:beta-alanine-activating enzyme isoform X1 [Suncus etruscus]
MTLQELVHQAASLYSDKTAVCFDKCNNQPPEYYTYKTVVTVASELSHFLLSQCDFQGIREIGLYCHPGINLPSWILGILQVPAAYVPIDPDSPPTFSAHFMKKCNLKFILVEKQQVNTFRSSFERLLTCDITTLEHKDLVLLKLHWKNVEMSLELNGRKGRYEKEKLVDSISVENSHEEKFEEYMDARQKEGLAYVLHTSGTTGTPKIVRVPHACIMPNINHFREIFEVTQNDVLFLASPLTFDPSVVEIFVALTSGASLLIVPTSVKVLPTKLAAVLFSRHRVTVLQATPTLLRRFGSQLIKTTVLSTSTSLRVLALGGEAFPSLAILKSWRGEDNKTQIFNIYGITEVSSWATFYKIPEKILNSPMKQHEMPVPLGFPLLETVIEVRDVNGFTIQEGIGQLFLGGRNRVCFLDDEMIVPFGTMRATGDFVTVEDGEMFFLGRKDSQIKRHGKRLNIELVQQVAEGIEQVESCAVTWYNQEKLILFLVSKADIEKDYIFQELQEQLPSHAIPDELVPIDVLPFTSHGKIDVLELNKIYLDYVNLKSEAKFNGKEELWEKLQHLWKSILNLSEYPLKSSDESFINSGGDSLKSIRLLSEIEKLVGTSVPGLLEILLTSSIVEIYNHIVRTVYPGEELKFSKTCATKRKFSNVDQEENTSKSLHSKTALPLCSDGGDGQINSFIALSRGSQILSRSTTGIFTKSGQCPSTHTSDLTSQTNTQTVQDFSSPALLAKLQEPPCTVKIFEERIPKSEVKQMEFHVRWRSDTGKCVDASPLVVISSAASSSATVYIGSHSHTMVAVDLYSGKEKWKQVLGDRIESSACLSKCGNFIAIGCYNGSVYVLKSNSGEKHWVFTTEDAVKSSAALDLSTGLLYIGSHDQHAYALDVYARRCIWKSKCGGAIFSSPCVSLTPHHVYLATLGGLLLAVNPATGDRLWKHDCGKPLFSSPCCCLEYICIGCVDGNLLCFTHFGEKVKFSF